MSGNNLKIESNVVTHEVKVPNNVILADNPYLNTSPSNFDVNQPYGTNDGKTVDIFTQNGGTPYTPIFNPAMRVSRTGYCCHCNSRYYNWNQHLGVCSARRINIVSKTSDDRDLYTAAQLQNFTPLNSAGFSVTEEPLNPNLPVSWGGSGEIIINNRASIDTSGSTPSLKVTGFRNTIPVNLSENNPYFAPDVDHSNNIVTTSLNSIQTTQCPGNYCVFTTFGGTGPTPYGLTPSLHISK